MITHTLKQQYSSIVFLTLMAFLATNTAQGTELEKQRALFTKIEGSLASGSTRLFEQHKKEMQDYPLFPYLEYARLNRRLELNDQPSIDSFLTRYPDAWISNILRRKWLELLYGKRQWQLYTNYFRPASASVELQCHFHFARYQLGEVNPALNDALKLWLVGNSQPKGCDPLFEILIREQRISNDIAWQRYTMAILNHEFGLASYIERFFTSPRYRRLAKDYLSIERDPELVGKYDLFGGDGAEFLAIIEHGIRHLANRKATLAMKHWARYQQIHAFEESSRRRILSDLVKNLYNQGLKEVAANYLNNEINFADNDLLEWHLRNLLTGKEWELIVKLLTNLPESIGQEQRWRYWSARALLLHSTESSEIDAAKTTMRELSRFRSFYGFLACDWVGNPYEMQHHPVANRPDEVKTLELLPGVQRAREFFHHRQYVNARREWYAVGNDFDAQQWVIAAQIAKKWQWHQQVVLSLSKAEYWDDIDLRFPLAFRKSFLQHAQTTALPLPLVFAIARQESALAHDVASPAGALGLMQLMPKTANEVAQKHRIPYRSSQQLIDPELNIRLGSLYYKSVLQHFGNNRILATAAYNAGPTRVNQWLKKSAGQLPFDAWIETIPFRETRQYVQNVLAFSVIYAHHLKTNDPLLNSKEHSTLL